MLNTCLAMATATHLLMSASPTTPDTQAATQPDRAIRYEFVVAAPPAEVWKAWTTDAGLRSFFSPTSRIVPKLFGEFDIHQNPPVPGEPEASRPNIIIGMQPERLLVTTWDAPVEFPEVRRNRTVLMIGLAPVGSDSTRVTLVNTGYGSGGEWDKAFEYFEGAWSWVAAALQHRFASGAIAWTSPPDLSARMFAIGGDAARRWMRQMQQAQQRR